MDDINSIKICSRDIAMLKRKSLYNSMKQNENPIKKPPDIKKEPTKEELKITPTSDLIKKKTLKEHFLKKSSKSNKNPTEHQGVKNIQIKPITRYESNNNKPIGIIPIVNRKKDVERKDKNIEELSNLFISSDKAFDDNKLKKSLIGDGQKDIKVTTTNNLSQHTTKLNETNIIYSRKKMAKDDMILNIKKENTSTISKSNSVSLNKSTKNFLQIDNDVHILAPKKSTNKSKTLMKKNSFKKILTESINSEIIPSHSNLLINKKTKTSSVTSSKKFIKQIKQLQSDYPQKYVCNTLETQKIESKKPIRNLNCGDEMDNNTEYSNKLKDDSEYKENNFSPMQMEYLYYSTTLKEIAPKLSEEKDRQKIILWLKKMFKPEYMTSVLQMKRNKYLMFICLSILNDEVYNILSLCPPNGLLPEIKELPETDIKPPNWEFDNTWKTSLQNIPDEEKTMECSVHKDMKECKYDHQWDKLFDEEFSYFLYLAKPYSYLFKNSEDISKIQAWISKLCKINTTCCSKMRGIRNDYMMLLLGYIQEREVAGPFKEYPSNELLKPLREAFKSSGKNNNILNPTNDETQLFLDKQPIPNEGAFCYVAVTGDLVESKSMKNNF